MDDLTEPEGDDCEIVASHPDHRRTDEEPATIAMNTTTKMRPTTAAGRKTR